MREPSYEEMVADSMEGMLTSGNAVQMLAELRQQDKTLWQKIRDWFQDMAGRIKAVLEAYKGVKPDSVEGKLVADMQDVIVILESLYTDALVDAAENYNAGAQKNTTGESGGVRYALRYVDQSSVGGYDFTKSFKDQLDDYEHGTFPPKDTFLLGKTPEVLRKIGLADVPLTMDQTHVSYALDGSYSGDSDRVNDHILSKEDLAKIPALISDPVAIIQDKQLWQKKAAAYSVDVLIEMEINGKKTLVAVNVNSRGYINGTEIDSNRIQTIHGNSDTVQRLVNAMNEDSDKNVAVFYINKEKATKFLRPAGNPISRTAKELNGFIHSVTDPGSNVKMRISAATESHVGVTMMCDK